MSLTPKESEKITAEFARQAAENARDMAKIVIKMKRQMAEDVDDALLLAAGEIYSWEVKDEIPDSD